MYRGFILYSITIWRNGRIVDNNADIGWLCGAMREDSEKQKREYDQQGFVFFQT
jgi:hypothetical protein